MNGNTRISQDSENNDFFSFSAQQPLPQQQQRNWICDDNSNDTRTKIPTELSSDSSDASIMSTRNIIHTKNNKGKYSNFSTIDWPLELAKDRQRQKTLKSEKWQSFWHWLKFRLDSGSGWFCVMLVGIFTGITAAFIDVSEGWLSDFKLGFCVDKFWLDHEHCCTQFNSVKNCTTWKTWANILETNEHSFLHFFVDFTFYLFSSILMAFLSACLVVKFAPYASGSGIAEIKCIMSGFVIRRFLGIRTFIGKTFGIILSSASGLSLGKEGPAVHVSSCIGNVVSRWFPKYSKNEAKKREILSASTAAALSVAFGAPIGGILFSIEEASYYFTFKTLWRSFFCALVAGLSVRAFNPFGNTLPSLYHVEHTRRWMVPELIPFALIGVVCGLLGSAFIRLNMRLNRYRKNSIISSYPITEVVSVAFITSLLAYGNPFTKISSAALIRQMFNDCDKDNHPEYCYNYPIEETGIFVQLCIALFMKFCLTVITAGLKVPAGLFVPNIATGALTGRIIGLITQSVANKFMIYEGSQPFCKVGEDCVMPGLYAIVGAAALLSGVMRMTVTLVIIMFELTGSIDFVVPTMAAIMIAKWVGDATYPMGIYDAQIELNNFPFLDNKENKEDGDSEIQDLLVRHRKTEPLIVIQQSGMTIHELEKILNETSYCGFPVVESLESKLLVGFCDRRNLQANIAEAVGIDFATPVAFTSEVTTGRELRWLNAVDVAPICVSPLSKIEIVAEMFAKLGLRQVLVTEKGELIGIVTKKDLLTYLREI
uniref:Chloride channel protein n=1 Tax=Panagrolaimus sp. PS1159 TaxID=55785 RepID=A0AC35EV14_9BILA